MPIDALLETTRYAPQKEVDAARRMYEAQMAAERQAEAEAAAAIAAQRAQAQQLWNGYDYNAEAARRAQVGGFDASKATQQADPLVSAMYYAQQNIPSGRWKADPQQMGQQYAMLPGTDVPANSARGQAMQAVDLQAGAAQAVQDAIDPFAFSNTAPGILGTKDRTRAYTTAGEILRSVDATKQQIADYNTDADFAKAQEAQQKAVDDYRRQQTMSETEAGNQLAELYRQRDELQKLISTTSSAFRDSQGQALNNTRQEQLARINAQIRQYEADVAAVEKNRLLNEYAKNAYNADFRENSQYRKTYGDEAVQNYGLGALFGGTGENKFVDIDDNARLYELINGNSEIREQQLQDTQNAGGTASAAIVNAADPLQVVKYMSGREKALFNYIYNTQGGDAARQYYDLLVADLNARYNVAETQRWAKEAKEHPLGASIASVAASPMKGLSLVGQTADMLSGEGIDSNAPYNTFSNMPSAVRSQVAHDIERNYGKAGSFAYNTAMSMADNLWQMAITGGEPGQNLMLAIMGSGAAADSVRAAKSRGLSDGQAYALGLASGAIEALTEKIGLDALYEGIKGGKTALRAILNSTLAEGSEEVLGTFLDDIADMIIAGTDSERMRRIAELKAQGMSDSEAAGRAYVELLKEAGVAGLSGALSGLLMSGGAQAIINGYHSAQEGIQTARDTREQNRVDEMVRMANEEAAKRYANILNPQNAAQTEQTAEAPQIAPEAPAQTATPAPTPVQTTNDTATQTAQETPIQNGENEQPVSRNDRNVVAEGTQRGWQYEIYQAPNGVYYMDVANPQTGEAHDFTVGPREESAYSMLNAFVQSNPLTATPAQANTEQTLADGTNVGGEPTPLSPKNEERSVGAATAGQFSTEFDELGEKYGWQDVTAKDAAYAVRYPRSTNGKDRVSATVGNALSARVTDDYMASLIEANTVKGAYSFIPISNDATTRKATRRIKNIGWEAAMKEFHDAARTGKNSADLQAMGMILYNNAVNSGDYQAALNILADFQVSGTTIARALQIRQILRKLTPEGKLYSIQKAVKDLDQKLTNNGRNMIGEPFVFEYSDAVGRKIADGVAKKLKVKSPKAQTFLQHIAAEISEIANEQIPADVKEDTKRARRDFVRDYILNHDFFDEAYQKAKEEVVRQYEDRGEEIPPELEELLNSSLRDAMYEQLVGRSDVTISDDALEAFAYAQTPTEEQEAMKRIAKEISSQLPSTLEEKINALRYLNMLGNFRTQNRNILGNSAMFLAASAKYYTAAGIERIVSRINPNFEKSKAVNPGKARLDAARQAFKTYEDYVLGEAKYNDMNSRSSNEIMRMAEDEKTVFKFGDNRLTRALGIANKQGPVGKALQAMSNATNWMMEHGDIPFAKVSFVRSLAGYMAAHNVTAEQWNNPEWQMRNASFVDKAVQYAANQAQQDTFRDNNAFSTWVSKFGRTPNTPKAARVALEGLLPFRKTPANVTVRAVEYSPLGILTTAVDAVKAAQGGEKNGRVVTGADIVDDIAKNFTGTALVALGWILAKQGILRGGDDDDDRVAAWNDQLGHQSYSIEIGGTSYTLDWVAPAAIPLFIGAEIFNATKDKNYSFSDLEGAFTKITEPMLKMSMLQSVDDFLNGGYDSNGLQKVAQLGASYLTQGLTSTLLGQLERTLFEPNRVATYKDPTRNMPKWLQGAIGKASAKIPGIDAYQYEYVDLWGRAESNGPMWERAVTNFLSPGYVSHVDMDSVETEIQRLYDYLTESGSDEASSVLPAAVKRTGLSREDYVKKAQTVGAARAGVLSSMFATQAYQHMSPEDQAKAVQCVYEYANATAKADTSKSAKWIRDALSSRDPAQVILRHVRAS